jgi:hypothetical protein
MRPNRFLVFAALALLVLATRFSRPVSAAIYWADYYGGIGRVEMDGSNPTVIVPAGPLAQQPTGLKIVGDTMYWCQAELLGPGHVIPNRIVKSDLNGGNIATVLNIDRNFWGLDVANGTAYFNCGGAFVFTGGLVGAGKVPLAGAGAGTATFYGEPEGESLIADPVNDLLFYQVFDANYSIRRRALSGGPATTILTKGAAYADFVAGLAVDPVHQYLYYTDSNNNGRQIKRANYDGSGEVTIANVGGTSRLYSIDLDVPNQTIYYGEAGGRIGKVKFDGTGDTQIYNIGAGHYLYSIEIPEPGSIVLSALSASALLLGRVHRRRRRVQPRHGVAGGGGGRR